MAREAHDSRYQSLQSLLIVPMIFWMEFLMTARVTSDRVVVASKYYPASVKNRSSYLGKEIFARYGKLNIIDAFENFATT